MEKSIDFAWSDMGDWRTLLSSPGAQPNLWVVDALLFSEKHHPQLLFDEFESRVDARCGNLAYLAAASSDWMLLEEPQIDLPYSLNAVTRWRFIHVLADQGVGLSLGSAYENSERIFEIDDHADHAPPESASRCARLHDDAFSWHIFNNLRIVGDICQFGIISQVYGERISAPPLNPVECGGNSAR